MTPFEELQAAHKRLSELRGPVDVGHEYRNRWRITAEIDGMCEVGTSHGEVISTWQDNGPSADLPVTRNTADLIVTLHRTIDAQLYVIDHAFATYEQMASVGHTGSAWCAVALPLARAINGEES